MRFLCRQPRHLVFKIFKYRLHMTMKGQSAWVDELEDRFYGAHRPPRQNFFEEIKARVNGNSHTLDFGAGRGNNEWLNLKGAVKRAYGVDVDEAVEGNPLLHEARVVEDGHIPYGDDMFDVVYSAYVLEHLEYPEASFAEIKRVLKPGGAFVALTPNVYHYVPLIASLTPHWFHEFVMGRLSRGREEADIFPTFYRANSAARVAKSAKSAGLETEKIVLQENKPNYLRFNAMAYMLGIVYERLTNNVVWLRNFRSGLLIVLVKPVAEEK